MVCINRIPHILFFCCGGVFIFLLFSNTTSNGEMLQSHEVSYGDAIALYETKNNLLEGDYMSCYKNQTVKCRGQFHNNMRVGLWTVYDSLGNEKMQRKYRNNFEFEQIYPPLPKSGPIKILKEPYPLKYNKDGFIDYFFLNERAVVVSKRIWRTIDLDPYHLTFFSSQKLMGSIVDSVIAKKYVEYADDDFRDTISKSGLAMLLDTANYYLEGFDCKEDWFFDNDRMLSETRIIGISPLVIPRGDVGDKPAVEVRGRRLVRKPVGEADGLRLVLAGAE